MCGWCAVSQFKGSADADDAVAPEKERFSFVDLVRRVQSNAKRYLDVMSAAADFCLEELQKAAVERGEPPMVAAGSSIAVGADGRPLATETDDVFDVLYQ